MNAKMTLGQKNATYDCGFKNKSHPDSDFLPWIGQVEKEISLKSTSLLLHALDFDKKYGN